MAISFIKNFVAKALFKKKGAIANNKAVEFSSKALEQRLINLGIDPNAIKSEKELQQILAYVKQAEDKAFDARFGDMLAGSKFDKQADVLDMTGKKIDPNKPIIGGKQFDDDLPPPGSRGGDDDIAAPIQSGEESLRDMMEAEIKKKIEKQNKEAAKKLRDKKTKKDDSENKAQGGRIGYFGGGAGKYQMDLPFGEPLFTMVMNKKLYGIYQNKDGSRLSVPLGSDGKPSYAKGGRAGFKEGSGMNRRSFLKILGGLASIPILGKFLKPVKTAKGVSKVPVIMTDKVAGKPEWFDALVNKVILEGDDVTAKFATGERQSIHSKKLDDGSVVRVTEDIDQGAVRVEYDSADNVFEDTVQMEYKKPLPDEGDPNPAAEFTTAESGPVGRQSSPDDFDIDIDEVGGSSISDLDSDVSKLKEFATGKGPNLREIVQNKKRKDKAKAITNDPEAQSDAVVKRQGEALDYDDYAAGGIARMLGE